MEMFNQGNNLGDMKFSNKTLASFSLQQPAYSEAQQEQSRPSLVALAAAH